jgi:hypothetical protein
MDFTEIKKSMKKSKKRSVEERAPIVGAFVTLSLRVLQLTGEVLTIVSFLRCIASPLTHLDLVIEDLPTGATYALSFRSPSEIASSP